MDIEKYLDGSMAAAERAEFEQKIQSDANLRAELGQYRDLHSDLAWYFAEKDVRAVVALRAKQKAKRSKWIAIVLTILLATLIGLLAWRFLNRATSQSNNPVEIAPLPPQPEAVPQKIPTPEVPEKVPSVPKKHPQPIAGVIMKQTDERDLMRDFPAEPISEESKSFFEKQWKNYTPAVPETGQWSKPLQSLREHKPAEARILLKKMPASDTASYILAITELLLHRPSAAQGPLYALSPQPKWQNEARYLLVWAYFLEGNTDLAKASLQLLPVGFRDREAVLEYLEQ